VKITTTFFNGIRSALKNKKRLTTDFTNLTEMAGIKIWEIA
jgi:hypothetical protein